MVLPKKQRDYLLKVREAMSSSENNPIDGIVHVDECVIGGKEQGQIGRSDKGNKKKAITAVELTKDGKLGLEIQYIKHILNLYNGETRSKFSCHLRHY